MQKKTKMVSLDTSSTVTGYAYYEDGILKKHGIIDCSKEKDTEIRLEDMCFGIIKILSELKPIIVVIELTSVQRNAATQRLLSEIVGVVRGWTLYHYAEFVRYRPSEWRHLVCSPGEVAPINRKEAKEWAFHKIREYFGVDCDTDDEAEAILIGQARINQMQRIQNTS